MSLQQNNSAGIHVCTDSKGPYHAKDETVQLNYIEWQDKFATEKPYEVISEAPAGFPRANFSCSLAAPETIHDIRGREKLFNLQDHGFQIWKHDHTVDTFDKASVEQNYLPSLDILLKDVLGPGTETYFFDWRIRSSDRSKSSVTPGAIVDLDDPLVCLLPVQTVHVDQSPLGAVNRVRYHMGERADDLLKKRCRIINLWRPMRHTINNFPLAVCDGGTVPKEKLLTVDHVRKTYVGESMYPLACPERYKWYYLNRQEKEEVLLFKTYDSDINARAKCCPHTSFVQSGARADGKPRETIEVRALVFTEE
ncbi:putative 7 alpha-cephem-methoxylase [Trichoderma afarasin]